MNKKLNETILHKDKTIRKVQFDKTWFYNISDMEAYLGESLEGVETVTLPILEDGIGIETKCTTLLDIHRLFDGRPKS